MSGEAGALAFIQNLGTGELLLIGAVALIFLGPEKLPDAARQIGALLRRFRRMSDDVQREFRESIVDPVMGPVQEVRDLSRSGTPAPTPAPERDLPDNVTELPRPEAAPSQAAAPEAGGPTAAEGAEPGRDGGEAPPLTGS